MSRRLVDTLTRVMDAGSSRRSFLKQVALGATALSVAPADYVLRPVSAFAAICGCGGQNCDCASACCDGYTEFCCTLNAGVNACPAGSFAGGWWKADGSMYCQGPRYYIDCMAQCSNCSSGCGSGAFCDPMCDNTLCTCAGGSCDSRRSGCTTFRYGQCHQEIACSGRITCRVASCTPPWTLDSTCTMTSFTDDTTANHNVPCLQGPPPLGPVIAVRMDGANHHSEVHVLDGTDGYQRFTLETVAVLGATNPAQWSFTSRAAANGSALPDVMAIRMDGATNHSEVHVLSGQDNFARFKLETISILGRSNPTEWAFAAGTTNSNGLTDVIAIRMDGAGGHSEIHVLDGSSNYQTFKLETVSTLGTTNSREWRFTSGTVDKNGLADIIAIRMDGDTKHTDVHVLDAGSKYQTFKLETATVLGMSDPREWAFTSGDPNGNGLPDLVAIRMDGAGGKSEVHVLDGGANYQGFKLETVTALGTTTPAQWAFPS